jgi:phosphonate transport system substrate-binding protein
MSTTFRFGFSSKALAATLMFVGIILGIVPPAFADGERRLTLGRITEEPGRNIDRLNAMAEYLSTVLAPDGIEAVDVVIAQTPEEMAELLRAGRVDLFSETPFIALELMEAELAEPMLREWKKGVPEYHTVIFVHKDRDIESLSDLRGQKFAFEDPGSTSGYLLPRAALIEAGLSLEKLDNPRDELTSDTATGYSFAKGEINIVAWVNRGLADAGSVSNLDWANPKKCPPQMKRDLKIIHETPPVVRSLMMVRRSVDPALKQRLASILMGMHETEDGAAALKAYFKVSQYDLLDDEELAKFETVRSLWRTAGIPSD